MNDTPEHIRKKQNEIYNSKSAYEKSKCIVDLTELSRKIIVDQLRKKNPEMSETDIKVELFRIFYKDDFEPEKLDEISEFLRKTG